jgi:SAM-dependent methyltransferase
MTGDKSNCTICGGTAAAVHETVEMMFGMRDCFHYRECAECGCLQLSDAPPDMSRYYPPNYYSFYEPVPYQHPESRLRRWMSRQRNSGQILGVPFTWRLVARVRPRPDFEDLASLFRRIEGVTLDSPILDVGCGKGHLLHRLAAAGFTNLWGVDPYVDGSREYPPSLRILACELADLQDVTFDFVMLHHSLEHMPDQDIAFREIKRVLAPHGTCLIRIPVADSEPWDRYRTNWVELDPPRHIHLHTRRSIEILAERHQMRVAEVHYDSTAFAYWASELYRREKSLVDPVTRRSRNPADFFTPQEIAEFENSAAAANRQSAGGRAAFYLRHIAEN